ncbi:hypothetical protein EV701_101131 [Chthoniobacter flavus]|nr:hypothetical protein EV701_101131 [Chthoniobacter flavus]
MDGMRLTIAALPLVISVGFQAASFAAPPLPKIEITEIRAPASTEIIVQHGSNLRTVAAEAYGHQEFSRFVGQLNGIAVPERLRAGATLKTPSLPTAFRDAGLEPRYQPGINALAKAWQDLQVVLPQYAEVRNASGLRDGQSFPISPDLRAKLVKCADLMDAAIGLLQHPSNEHSVPQATIGQFEGAAASLRQLSTGTIGSRDYDVFMIQKRIGLGFYYALIWTQQREQ